MKTTLRTNELLQNIIEDTPTPENEISFVDKTDALHSLATDIRTYYESMTDFANSCYIEPTHISQFLKNKKNMGRNKILMMFIKLRSEHPEKYTLSFIQQQLTRLSIPILYSRNARDYAILLATQNKHTIDEVNEILQEKGFESLCQEK